MKKAPIIMQLEALECGAASLAMVMAYYGKWVPLEQVRIDCGVSRDGSKALNIIKAARSYGFNAKGFAYSVKHLQENGKFPCILFWNKSHFVVLNGFTKRKAIINDPAHGLVKVPIADFEKQYSGICLEFEPGENFTPSGKRKSMSQFAKKRLVGASSLVVFFVLTSIIIYTIGLINPIINQVFMDNLLGGKEPDWLMPFIIIVSIVSFLQIAISLIEAIYKYRIREKMALVGSSTYMWKILRLPIEFFSQRLSGDIQQRKNENATIAEMLVNIFAPLVFNTMMLVFYLIVMINKSLILTALGVTTVLLNAVISYFISEFKTNIARVQARDNALLIGTTSKGIEMIETIKSSGSENSFYNNWGHLEENASNQKLKMARYNLLFGIIPAILGFLVNYGVLLLGVYLTINGQFTIGSIFAFQGFLSSFMAPANIIISSGQSLQEMRTQMERVDDVMEYPNDPNIDNMLPDDNYEKLQGDVVIDHLTFGYSKLDSPVIEDFSLSVRKGETVAIVGGSGCGKSTLSKLISGLYPYWSGSILYDGKEIKQIDHEVFVSSVGVVDQDIILFSDTIENNIKMWDETISDEDMIKASRDAMIHDTIMTKANGYSSRLSENGKNLSGGERQRIEIARALVQNPNILILDEATSALDAKTEYEVVKSIKERNITCFVIAHRLSTIKDADKIIVLNQGKIVEEGRHEELLKLQGYYYNLIKSE